MSISRRYNVPLASLSTFRMGGIAHEVITVENEADIIELFTTMPAGQRWFVLGGGSNVVFPDGDCHTVLIHFVPSEITLEKLPDGYSKLTVSAGTIWDDVVAFAVARGLSGIEALSAIPGTAGATPIQNVGAYGVETKDVLTSVRAYDIETKKIVIFSNEQCEFGYRDSIFKNAGKGRYIITEVAYILSHDEPDVPQYLGVAEYFAEKGIRRPSLQDIRDAIIFIRSKKLPDPREIASVGSFFKNALVSVDQANNLKEQYPTLAVFPISDTVSKIGTGSLIDTLGWKGKNFGSLSIYKGNALVIVNEGGATRRELTDLIEMIKQEVQKKYGISIEPEPELLNFE